MKKVFIDATGIVPVPTGLGKYSYYLLNSLLQQSGYSFTVLHQSNLPESHELFLLKNERVTFMPTHVPVIGPARDIALWRLSLEINRQDIFHCLSSYLPAFGIDIPCLLTIHDLKYLLFPEFFKNNLKTLYYSWIIRRGTRKATHIIAVSEATKSDLIALNVSSEKITVIPEAATLSDTKRKLETQLPDSLKDKSFFLFVGDNRPHKNITRMLEAHQILLKKLGKRCPYLVFAGPNFGKIMRKYSDNEKTERLIFLGSVYEETLISLYKHAVALVYPSLYEGFGLPILEAMSLGTPVITSNCSSMPEVAGGAALLIDPCNVEELADALLGIVTDDTERARLKTLGVQRVKQFSWVQTADSINRLYENIS